MIDSILLSHKSQHLAKLPHSKMAFRSLILALALVGGSAFTFSTNRALLRAVSTVSRTLATSLRLA